MLDDRPPPRVIFLDAGHTLLEPHPPVEVRYATTAAAFGAAPDPEVVRERFTALWREGRSARERRLFLTDDEGTRRFWFDFVREVLAPWVEELTDYGAFFDRLYDEFTTDAAWRLFADVRPTLARWRREGTRLAVVSNWDLRLPALLESLGLAGDLEAVIVSAEVGFEKPAPVVFERALAAVGIEPSEALHVGDSFDDDVVGALGAGLRAAHLVRGAAPERVKEIDVEGLGRYVEVGSLPALADWLVQGRG